MRSLYGRDWLVSAATILAVPVLLSGCGSGSQPDPDPTKPYCPDYGMCECARRQAEKSGVTDSLAVGQDAVDSIDKMMSANHGVEGIPEDLKLIRDALDATVKIMSATAKLIELFNTGDDSHHPHPDDGGVEACQLLQLDVKMIIPWEQQVNAQLQGWQQSIDDRDYLTLRSSARQLQALSAAIVDEASQASEDARKLLYSHAKCGCGYFDGITLLKLFDEMKTHSTLISAAAVYSEDCGKIDACNQKSGCGVKTDNPGVVKLGTTVADNSTDCGEECLMRQGCYAWNYGWRDHDNRSSNCHLFGRLEKYWKDPWDFMIDDEWNSGWCSVSVQQCFYDAQVNMTQHSKIIAELIGDFVIPSKQFPAPKECEVEDAKDVKCDSDEVTVNFPVLVSGSQHAPLSREHITLGDAEQALIGYQLTGSNLKTVQYFEPSGMHRQWGKAATVGIVSVSLAFIAILAIFGNLFRGGMSPKEDPKASEESAPPAAPKNPPLGGRDGKASGESAPAAPKNPPLGGRDEGAQGFRGPIQLEEQTLSDKEKVDKLQQEKKKLQQEKDHAAQLLVDKQKKQCQLSLCYSVFVGCVLAAIVAIPKPSAPKMTPVAFKLPHDQQTLMDTGNVLTGELAAYVQAQSSCQDACEMLHLDFQNASLRFFSVVCSALGSQSEPLTASVISLDDAVVFLDELDMTAENLADAALAHSEAATAKNMLKLLSNELKNQKLAEADGSPKDFYAFQNSTVSGIRTMADMVGSEKVKSKSSILVNV